MRKNDDDQIMLPTLGETQIKHRKLNIKRPKINYEMMKKINLFDNIGVSNVFKVLTANYMNKLKKKETIRDVKILK